MKFLAKCNCLLPVIVCSFSSEHGWCDSRISSQQTGTDPKSATLNAIYPHLPALTLDRLSSGALRMLDHGGNLARSPSGGSVAAGSVQASTDPIINAGLDPRVGSNIRLGSDPTQLPSNLRAQAEPHIARHPTNSDLLVGTFQEGRYTDGGAVDCGYAVSHDGGLSWSRALIPGVTPVTGGPYYRASDPVLLTYGKLAVVYWHFSPDRLEMVLSTNGGNTFNSPRLIANVATYDAPGIRDGVFVSSATCYRTLGQLFVVYQGLYLSKPSI